MLKRRLIPKLLLASDQADIRLVTTKNFNERRQVGNPVSQAKIFEAQGADELIFLDLDARKMGQPTRTETVEKLAEEIFMPFAVGGGVNSLDDFQRLLDSGADKVIINTAALERPKLIEEAARKHGAQCVLLAIDVIGSSPADWEVVGYSGKRPLRSTGPIEWAKMGESLGAGELMITSVNRDGTGTGLDLELGQRLSEAVGIPVVLSGGCGLASHFVEGFLSTTVTGIAAGTFFSSRDQNMTQLRSQVLNAGISVRRSV